MNKTTKIMIGAGAIIVLLYVGFQILNSYIYSEKQAETTLFPEGAHFGFITSFTDNGTALDFDSATWLTGEAADDAAIRAGFCTEDSREECLPNGYFIENEVQETDRINVADNPEVFLMTWRMEETGQVTQRPVPFPEFVALINDGALHWSELPYVITVSENTVTRIEEVYVP
jgi:hypothetical protein